MAKEIWEKQKELKYQQHDFSMEDVTIQEWNFLKGNAKSRLVNTSECDQAKLIIDSFLEYLNSKGLKIIKLNNEQKKCKYCNTPCGNEHCITNKEKSNED